MATVWKSTDQNSVTQNSPKKNSVNPATKNPISGTMLSSWSRQQKIAMFAAFAILGLLLVVSACSKQASKTALVGVSGNVSGNEPGRESAPAPNSANPSANPVETSAAAASTAPVKKVLGHKKRPTNVIYKDADSGVSFVYPRKFSVKSGDNAYPEFAGLGAASMNFVQPGGVPVATVVMPDNFYPGTDFASAFLNVNVNRSLSEQECAHFAMADSHNVNGAAADAQTVKVGPAEIAMATTSNFSGSALTRSETQYYHSYQSGACYEYIVSLGTAGFGSKDGAKPVNRDEVFAKLEKIMATVKISPRSDKDLTEPTVATIATGK
ncbi:MAG TPA: hypothetical protein VKR59_17280 [Terriglobales bacterium]|nr:hypothetical protein [Terriglobales bacterium]